MTNPYRAMCAELLRSLENYPVQPSRDRDLCVRARALLAQPVAEWPSDEDLWKLYDDKLGQIGFAEDWPWIFNYVRAVLAKWGAPMTAEVPDFSCSPGNIAQNNITFQLQGNSAPEEIIRLDSEGFHYRSQLIEDAGEAHRLFIEFMRQANEMSRINQSTSEVTND